MDSEPYVSGTRMKLMFVAVLQGHPWILDNFEWAQGHNFAWFMSTSRTATPNQSLSFWSAEQFLDRWQGKTTAARPDL